MLKRYIGDKAFYKMVLALLVPMVIQQGITNFVNLLDNLMIGQLGTEQMTGVAIVNQLIYIFNLAIFGAVGGASIFGAQFFGGGDKEGVRSCHRFKIYVSFIFSAIAIVVLAVFSDELIGVYLHNNENGGDIVATLYYAKEYLPIMLIGLIPYALTQCYAATLKECGETFLPMISGVCAVITNCVLNFVLIFGKFGAPALGVAGAAIATVISRFVELAIIVIASHRDKYPFIKGVYSTFKIPSKLVSSIIIKSTPLIINEVMWALSRAMIAQLCSVRGLHALSATNISDTVINLFFIIFFSIGNVIGIVAGQNLGAGEVRKAKDSVRKLMALNLVCCIAIGAVLVCVSPLIPRMYNTTSQVMELATAFLMICGVMMPVFSFSHGCYFVLRCGGKTGITFLFDSVFNWVIVIPAMFFMVHFTSLHIITIYLFVQLADVLKGVFGFWLVKKGVWINNVVDNI